MNGVRQVECTINGLGERAGNAALEEIVMAVKTRKDTFPVYTDIATEFIVPTSRVVSSITGFPVQPNKSIVGANAFAHESGIHQDGVLKHRETYEIMRAEDVGWHTNKIVLGKHSGRAAVKARCEELGIPIRSAEQLSEVFERFKALADKKHEVFDQDLHALVSNVLHGDMDEKYELLNLDVTSKTGEKPNAKIALRVGDQRVEASAEGGGPVDAAYKAIESVVQSGADLLLYSVNAITQGTDSQGEVTARLEKAGQIVNGVGSDTDIVAASAKAYLHALNLLDYGKARAHPQHGGV